MATKKQKRLAGEARQAEIDAAHKAEIEQRRKAADARARRRMEREAAQERHAAALKAFNSGLRPSLD